MAVEQCDNRFDWCDKLLETRENYDFNECCNIVKNSLKTFKGADEEFLKDVCLRPNSKFSVRRMFYPVYYVEMKVTYDWDVERTEEKGDYTVTKTTHHTNTNTYSNDFYRNIYDSCSPNTFVGRNDERFYKLSHVDDLDGDIYNTACVYNQYQLENAIHSYALKKSPYPGADMVINCWTVTTCFVPVAIVSYTYQEKTYTATVNMHNGHSYCEYCVSKGAEEKAKKMRIASIALRVTSLVLSGIGVILGMSMHLIAIILALACFIVLCVTSAKLNHTKSYFLNEYGSKGTNLGFRLIRKEIIQVIVSVALIVLLIIIF